MSLNTEVCGGSERTAQAGLLSFGLPLFFAERLHNSFIDVTFIPVPLSLASAAACCSKNSQLNKLAY